MRDTVGQLSVTIVKRPPASTIRSLPTDPLPDPAVELVKSGCLVEVQAQTESPGLATMNTETVWVFMPPDSDSMGIVATDVLRFGSRDYQMQGPAAVEYGLDGEPVVVWCTAKWEAS